MDITPYPDSMFKWTLRGTMDAHGITRYALQKKTELSMNTIRAMYEGAPTRIDFPVIEKVIKGLSEIISKPIGADDVFLWEPDSKEN